MNGDDVAGSASSARTTSDAPKRTMGSPLAKPQGVQMLFKSGAERAPLPAPSTAEPVPAWFWFSLDLALLLLAWWLVAQSSTPLPPWTVVCLVCIVAIACLAGIWGATRT